MCGMIECVASTCVASTCVTNLLHSMCVIIVLRKAGGEGGRKGGRQGGREGGPRGETFQGRGGTYRETDSPCSASGSLSDLSSTLCVCVCVYVSVDARGCVHDVCACVWAHHDVCA